MSSPAKETLSVKLPNLVGYWSEFRGQWRVKIAVSSLLPVLRSLRNDAGFNQLTDLTCVDHLELAGATDRFELVYVLLNIESGERVIVKTFVNEPDLKVPSVTSIWFGADWLEREVYDMYGITFDGHPNFKRLLLPEGFASFPLRKDYPQQGRGERHNFPVITRAES
ncbi:MAG: NADH-quinone oxidoreductase subunit C [Pirellulaceae bacterium]|nr:NADH-quinone oxidoreductase subunit C [Pirellulaceae bacterium]